MVPFENAQEFVPVRLLGAEVFARFHGTRLGAQVVLVGPGGPNDLPGRVPGNPRRVFFGPYAENA